MSAKAKFRARGAAPATGGLLAPDNSALAVHALGLLALATVALLIIYAPALNGQMIWDDDVNITTNGTLRTAAGLRQMWLVPHSTQQYYPLTYTTHWVEYQLWGLKPFGYHVLNVLLHAIAALLLGTLLVRLQVPGAWLAAALFAVHPVEVESVAWITERKNVLSLVLALLSLLAYLRWDAPAEPGANQLPSRRGLWSWYAVSLVLYVAALFSKTAVVTLPAVLLVIFWWQRGRITWRDVAPLLPFFAVGVALSIITVQMERAEGEEWTLSLGQRLLLPGRALWFYAAKLAWPNPLVFFYPRQSIDLRVWWQYLFPAAALAVGAGLWLARGRCGRGPLAAVMIFAGVLTPALGFFTIYFTRYAYVADHFQYHASTALIALSAAGWTMLVVRLGRGWQSPARFATVAVLGLCAIVSWQRAHVYREPETFFRDTLARNPRCTIARSNLGGYLQTVGRIDEAIDFAREALETDPRDASAANNLAAALLARGTRDGFQPGGLDEIFDNLRTALDMRPRFEDAEINFAFALLAGGQPAAAVEHCQAALAIDPDNDRALVGMGTALASLGKSAESRQFFERALERNPDSAQAHHGLALALVESGQPAAAAQEFQLAIDIDPRLPEAHYALAGLLVGQQKFPLAEEHYAAAVRLRPGYSRAHNNLGVVRMNLGRTAEAINSFRAAVATDPEYAEARQNLERAIAVEQSEGQR